MLIRVTWVHLYFARKCKYDVKKAVLGSGVGLNLFNLRNVNYQVEELDLNESDQMFVVSRTELNSNLRLLKILFIKLKFRHFRNLHKPRLIQPSSNEKQK